MTTRRHYPTPEEILAIEHAARRAQAAEIERLFFLGVRKLGVLVTRGARALAPDPQARRPARPSAIAALGASLPAEMRERYANELDAAARVEPFINAALAGWDFVASIAAGAVHGAARGLHAAARSLDVVARHLRPAS